MSAAGYLKRPDVRLHQLVAEGGVTLALDPERAAVDLTSVETAVKYAGYLERQEGEVERSRRDERRRIPAGFRFDLVPGLSREVVQRLTQVRPDTLGQALRIPGLTPAAVAVLGAYVSRCHACQE
jgi:tRNA uridine 5-carboxymethylaminomethyl modification enzyme